MLFWRGWGIAVLPVMFGWIFLLAGLMIAFGSGEADPNADATVDRLFARAFALSAVTTYGITRWRARKTLTPSDPSEGPEAGVRDDFMFVPLEFYVYLFTAAALFMFARSLL
jgi:hypothetical protein